MNDDDPLLNSPLDAQFRAAHQALRHLVPPESSWAEEDDVLPRIVDDLEDLARRARDTAAEHVGPTFWWKGGPQEPENEWAPVILQADFDRYVDDDPPELSQINRWDDSALELAARAYRRECGWDHSPGEAGIWLLAVAPYSAIQTSEQTHWRGTLTGFVVLHDRDIDGQYESLAHAWTARAWRRRGIGASLVKHARERFAVSHAEGPATNGGRLLLERCAPTLLR
ncbi:GNAT family N-acetyltransferase [Cellulomonas fengjieae]|uniref:GNAT family N-acetyltransferase n=1 Tax=Cellulomonas fengjieae TaxID=2819978 RepID=UPI001AAF4AD5|nr:GNAT family N-acetyltransferase [Cellulomonas fengjieae]MBO3102207.1 hypothetical protein [Cellulomonas fengjieae]